MTNSVNSGYKRSWDDIDHDRDVQRRRRGSEDSQPKDWRDVYLKSPTRKVPPPAPRSIERRSGEGGRRRDEHRRPSDSGREKERDRGRRDERDRERDRDRGHRERRSRSRSASSRRTHSHHVSLRQPATAEKDTDEKEEGEISPQVQSSTRPSTPSLHTPRDQPVPSPPAQPSNLRPLKEKEQVVEMELDLPPSPPLVEDVLAARRAKRLAILAKYSSAGDGIQSQSQSPSSAVQPPLPSSSLSDPATLAPSPSASADIIADDHRTAAAAPETAINHVTMVSNGPMVTHRDRESMTASPGPAEFLLAKDDEQEDAQVKRHAANAGAEQVSAADYDPSLDRREDEQKRFGKGDDGEMMVLTVDEDEGVIEEEEDVDDMFAVAMSDGQKIKKIKKRKTVMKPAAPALLTMTNLDSAADPEGYYTVILGEQLDGGRYQVFSSIGKGMFANVVRARILTGDDVGKEVAIKIVRSQESMYRAGLKEVQILNKLRQADPDDKKHVVRLERTFEHRGHLCLVFEALSMNLRDVVKRFGKDVGLNIRAVRAYAHQLFLALGLLKKTNIMHADIKPDNILVNENKTVIKLCDLGSASDAVENEITPYLVSRFYRAPEIILGVPYDPALDIWSIGCTLYELYTGKILFPGRSNNQMLLLMMELKGRLNGKMIKRAKFGDVYFDEMGGFESVERDRVTGADVVRKVHISKPVRDMRARLMPPASVKLQDEESKMLVSFIDLLDRCLVLDPARRITPREALAHPFVRG